ncbi:trimethylguanosine synthase [[Candida] railenensis]|uniref:Trimethylguanosine synthase n=1 Tax=[Candida] railenensis TaxID=45579 RepID=A0A9P0VXM5_9ASCO|nr:trimethylguanosine synthase [[Candida] railenensis]
MTMDDFEIEDDNELFMHTLDTLPENCKKYWSKRYMLFSKFDEGVYMTSELWYSVTPEDVAIFVAKLVKELIPEAEHILDICCGGGGNSIQFGKYFKSVGAIDINKNNLACTEHNASIYGVKEHLWVYQGDWNEMASTKKSGAVNKSWIPKSVTHGKSGKPFDLVFTSPPWGGPSYKDQTTFDLSKMEPFSVKAFAKQILQYTDNFIMYLPRNSDLDQLREVTSELMGSKAKCRILYIEQFGYCVALLALFGEKLTTGDIDYKNIFPEDLEEGALVVKTPEADE